MARLRFFSFSLLLVLIFFLSFAVVYFEGKMIKKGATTASELLNLSITLYKHRRRCRLFAPNRQNSPRLWVRMVPERATCATWSCLWLCSKIAQFSSVSGTVRWHSSSGKQFQEKCNKSSQTNWQS